MAGIRKQAVKDTRELESKGLENTTLIKRLTTKTLLKSENQIIYLDSGLGTYLERILNSKDHIMSLQQIERINLLELLISLCATDESMNKLMEYGDPFPLLGMSTRALVIPELNKDWTIYDVKNLEDLMLFNSKKLPQLSPHLLEHKQREFMVLLTQFEEMVQYIYIYIYNIGGSRKNDPKRSIYEERSREFVSRIMQCFYITPEDKRS